MPALKAKITFATTHFLVPVLINRGGAPVQLVYYQWIQFEEFPYFMEAVGAHIIAGSGRETEGFRYFPEKKVIHPDGQFLPPSRS
jgi:hypothetical protein